MAPAEIIEFNATRERRDYVALRLANGEYSGLLRDKAVAYLQNADTHLDLERKRLQGARLIGKGLTMEICGIIISLATMNIELGVLDVLIWILGVAGIIWMVRGFRLRGKSEKALKLLAPE